MSFSFTAKLGGVVYKEGCNEDSENRTTPSWNTNNSANNLLILQKPSDMRWPEKTEKYRERKREREREKEKLANWF